MGWRINANGAVLNEEDVKAAHVSVVNSALEAKGWDAIDPISSPESLIVWSAVAISEATKVDLGESLVYVQSLPINEVIGFYTADVPAEMPEEPVEPSRANAGATNPDLVETSPGVRTNPAAVEALLRATRGI